MSPSNSPTSGSPKFVPLPSALPTKEEEEAAVVELIRDAKKKPKPYVKEHKTNRSRDSGIGTMSPYSFETRSPEQYSPTTRISRSREADFMSYEDIEPSKPATRYVTRDGKIVRVASRKQTSPVSRESDMPVKDVKYRAKYKAAKETTKVLEAALADYGGAAVHNLEAAQAQEAKIHSLQDELEKMTLKAQISQARAVAADRRYLEVQKSRRQEIEDELADLRLEQQRRKTAVEAPRADGYAGYLTTNSRQRRPTFIEQVELPRPTTITKTKPYTTPAVTSATSGTTFANPLDEAAADYNRANADIHVASTEARRRERTRDDRRHR